jgi:hypothetical protein
MLVAAAESASSWLPWAWFLEPLDTAKASVFGTQFALQRRGDSLCVLSETHTFRVPHLCHHPRHRSISLEAPGGRLLTGPQPRCLAAAFGGDALPLLRLLPRSGAIPDLAEHRRRHLGVHARILLLVRLLNNGGGAPEPRPLLGLRLLGGHEAAGGDELHGLAEVGLGPVPAALPAAATA